MTKIKGIVVFLMIATILVNPCTSAKAAGKTVSKALFNGITNKLTVKVKFRNTSKKEKYFGHDFSLQRKEQGTWQNVPMKEDYALASIAILVPAKKSVKYSYSLKSYFEKEQLVEGTYRIMTSYTVKKKNRYVKFQIKQ